MPIKTIECIAHNYLNKQTMCFWLPKNAEDIEDFKLEGIQIILIL